MQMCNYAVDNTFALAVYIDRASDDRLSTDFESSNRLLFVNNSRGTSDLCGKYSAIKLRNHIAVKLQIHTQFCIFVNRNKRKIEFAQKFVLFSNYHNDCNTLYVLHIFTIYILYFLAYFYISTKFLYIIMQNTTTNTKIMLIMITDHIFKKCFSA